MERTKRTERRREQRKAKADSTTDRGQVQGRVGASGDGKAGVITEWNVHKIVEMYAEHEQTDRKAVDMATFSKYAHI